MSTITHISIGFGNSALRVPYALAHLDCGHVAGVQLKSHRGTCSKCGKEHELPTGKATTCVCGSQMFRITYMPNPHNECDRVTAVGDCVNCDTCQREAAQIKWLEGVDPKQVQHARYRTNFAAPRYDLYRRDASSPTGVLSMGSVPASAEAILRRKGICTLSPTEGLGNKW